jgi:pimeloyl-ACP methyl ester carboxylesterase
VSAVSIAMPKLGMTMAEGQVIAWPKPVGAWVEKGELLLVIESEKAEIEIEAPATGVLRHVYVEAGRMVPCGSVLAALTTTADEPFDADAFRREHDRPERPAAPVRSVQPATAPPRARGAGPAATPAARVLARRHDVDLAGVAGTGPGGRITREDVEAHLAARERRVPAGEGVSLEVLVSGAGDAVGLIPGLGCDVSVFARQVPALAAAHRVLGINPRGVGLSDAPAADVYDVGTMAREVLAVAGTAHLIGASLGAAVAVEAALLAPESVRSLTLVTPFVEASPRLLAVVEAWCRIAAVADAEAVAATLLPWMFTPEHLADADVCARTRRGLAQTFARVRAAALARHAAGLRAWSGTRVRDLARIAVPTLVVAGADDLLAPDARDVADVIPGARYIAVGAAGHAVAIEQPETVNEAVLAHLAGG